MGIRKWYTTGESHKELSENTVFTNGQINEFLNHDRIFLLVASKGMGKTLLLRYKKERVLRETRDGILVIPRNEPLDYAEIPANFAGDYFTVFQDISFWKDVWEMSIALSILSYNSTHDVKAREHGIVFTHLCKLNLASNLRDKLLECVSTGTKDYVDPSKVLSELLSLNVGQLQLIRNRCTHDIRTIYKQSIHRAVHVFIDSFDQALNEQFHYVPEIWKAGQLGLMRACFEINRHNTHIKVYTAIRQEAYADFHHENQMAMRGATLLLRYSDEDLHGMILKLMDAYENKHSIEEFLGCRKIENLWAKQEEDPYSYIYRHTVGTPRSLSVVCSELSIANVREIEESRRLDAIRKAVNDISGESVYNDYLESEMSVFLSELKDNQNIEQFFKLLRKNIMTLDNMKAIVSEYRRKNNINIDIHPFCELFNIGLIGCITTDHVQNKKIQCFRQPFEFDWRMSEILPESDYYFLHPSLNTYIGRFNPRYEVKKGLIIGNRCEWTKEHTNQLEKDKVRIFVSYSTADRQRVLKVVNRLKLEIDHRGLYYDFWLDLWRIRGGDNIQDKIVEGIKDCDYLLLMVSKKSMASGWVNQEWKTKFQEEINTGKVKIIAVFVDNLSMDGLPDFLKQKKAISLFKGNSILPDSMQGLCNDICAHVKENTRTEKMMLQEEVDVAPMA